MKNNICTRAPIKINAVKNGERKVSQKMYKKKNKEIKRAQGINSHHQNKNMSREDNKDDERN